MIQITIRYVVDGVNRSGVCWVPALDSMVQIANDLELIADGPIIVAIGVGGAKCKDCGSTDWDDLTPINTVPEYVCSSCYEKHDEKVMQ